MRLNICQEVHAPKCRNEMQSLFIPVPNAGIPTVTLAINNRKERPSRRLARSERYFAPCALRLLVGGGLMLISFFSGSDQPKQQTSQTQLSRTRFLFRKVVFRGASMPGGLEVVVACPRAQLKMIGHMSHAVFVLSFSSSFSSSSSSQIDEFAARAAAAAAAAAAPQPLRIPVESMTTPRNNH